MGDKRLELINYFTSGNNRVDELIQVILNSHKNAQNKQIPGKNFQTLAYQSGRWLKNDDILTKLPVKDTILAIASESERKLYDDPIESIKGYIDFVIETMPKIREQIQENRGGSDSSGNRESRAKIGKRTACPKSVKEALWRKHFGDQLNGECYVCSNKIAFTNFEVGHNKPVVNGGEWTLSNLRPLCRSCNRSMGTETVEDYKKKYFT
jgi:5-methylcytosine-specific restriction endonuclease McrA